MSEPSGSSGPPVPGSGPSDDERHANSDPSSASSWRSSQISVFEAAWYPRGLEQLMIDMVMARDCVHALMDKVMRFPLVAGRKFAEMGADIVWFGDDVSMQTGMMMSIGMWRGFLKPRCERLFAEVKRANPSVRTASHSCGNCGAILDDLIDIGLDILNPLQPMAIDSIAVKRRCGARGGDILAPAHHIQADTPRTNIEAFSEAARRMAQRRDAVASSG